MRNYKLLNNITGWLVFAIAAITYLLTIEPTASFWDCGEFITTSYKLEVGHPPGAPFFMILGRFFTLFGTPAQAGLLMNAMSGLASAFTILFLFWSITHLAKKAIVGSNELKPEQTIAILASGVVGALAYTFSDTFWFSAVEAEVYATSSLFTAIVFWAILKWENEADSKYANRWIIFIAYMVGLSIGVHLLNLLAIPAIVLVYYFKKYTPTKLGFIVSLILSFIILGVVMYGIIPGVITVASWFELMFVNGFGLPYNTGSVVYALALISAIVYGIYYTYTKNKPIANMIVTCFAVIILGYSSFAMIVIRSSANTPMDQNSPDNVFSLLSYLNREQYGNRPLIYGHYYNSPLDHRNRYEDTYTYIKKNDKYVKVQDQPKVNYNKDMQTIFPRMYSSQAHHIDAYKSWGNIKGRRITTTDSSGKSQSFVMPTFRENLSFFLNYQVNHMYLRYFMWNFAGRQNDIQGQGSIMNGNWISGISFIDNARLGDQSLLSDEHKNNKGRNTYFFLPLLLGLAGLVWHYYRKESDFSVVLTLFLMTGIAIVLYLNQSPMQVRERDYAYAASFYAFAIWIGLGVAALSDWAAKGKHNSIITSSIGIASLILVPGIMCAQNWDDHDRSGRYTSRDFGANYLNTCAPNSIIFTNGDNDTFPLWYNQEVEGVRTDMRVCNLSYLQVDWYIDQMKRKAYESDALPIRFTHEQYERNNRGIVYLIDRLNRPLELDYALNFVASDKEGTKLKDYDNASYLPANKFYYVVDKEAVIRNKVVPEELYDQIVDTIFIDYSKESAITRDQLMVLDMIASSNWERPLYFSLTVGFDKHYGLSEYFMLEGLAYRFVPIKGGGERTNIGTINTDAFYNNMMNVFKWGNMSNPDVYIDENNRRMMTNIRNNFNRLAESLLKEDKVEKAVEVLERSLTLLPKEQLPYDYYSSELVNLYYLAAKKAPEGTKEQYTQRARNIAINQFNAFSSQLPYLLSLNERQFASTEQESQRIFFFMQNLLKAAEAGGDSQTTSELSAQFKEYYNIFLN